MTEPNQEPKTGFAAMWLGMMLVGAVIVGGAAIHDVVTQQDSIDEPNPSEVNETAQNRSDGPQSTVNRTAGYPPECNDSSEEYDIYKCEGNFTFAP